MTRNSNDVIMREEKLSYLRFLETIVDLIVKKNIKSIVKMPRYHKYVLKYVPIVPLYAYSYILINIKYVIVFSF